jgi:glyoxylase-like metal-dependent hydrolase (beta-lactamase superfamily II)
MSFGNMQLWSVEGNHQRLDGGSMFGNVPRAVWHKWLPPDKENRIRLSCRGLLAKGLNDRNVLFETGVGAFFAPNMRARFGIEEDRNVLFDSLAQCGVAEADIDVVVLSHLHFDHAGGLLTDWQENKKLKLRFPKAVYLVGTESWQRACKPHPRDRASFIPELQALLESSGRMELVSGDSSAALEDSVRFRFSEGHTPGLMLSIIGGDGGVAFCSDLVPARPWVHLPVTMGFDRYPEKLVNEKRAFLTEMIRRNIRLFFTHDPDCAVATPIRDDRDHFTTIDEQATVTGSPVSADA